MHGFNRITAEIMAKHKMKDYADLKVFQSSPYSIFINEHFYSSRVS